MSVSADIKVIGIKDALKNLNKINPKLRRQITKDYAKIVKPVTDAAVQAVPELEPISGWASGWQFASGHTALQAGGWNGVKAQKMIKAKISTRRVKVLEDVSENAAVSVHTARKSALSVAQPWLLLCVAVMVARRVLSGPATRKTKKKSLMKCSS
jgi:hypothetical protein